MIMQADNWPILRLVRRVDPSARLALSWGVYETTVPVAAWQTIATERRALASDRWSLLRAPLARCHVKDVQGDDM